MTKTKMKAEEKFPIEKWPQIFDRMNCLGFGIHQRLWIFSCFGFFFAIFFGKFSEATFQPFFQEYETPI